jgi:hypothetical protein
MTGVVSTFPSVSYSLQTTRTWDYMGVNLHGNEPWTSTDFGKDMIVATIDTGALSPNSHLISDPTQAFGQSTRALTTQPWGPSQ